jgi:hypothetical protein
VESPGAVVFESPVGALRPLGSLASDRGGAVRLLANVNAASLQADDPVTFGGAGTRQITTAGGLRFAQALTLETDASLTASAGDLTLGGGVSGGGRSLVAEARGGLLSVNGDIGGPTVRLQTVSLAGRNVSVENLHAVGDIAIDISRDAGTPTTPNGYLRIGGTTVDSEKGAVVLGAGAWTPTEGADDRTGAPLQSSIFKANEGDLTLAGATVTVQPYERLAVRDGNLVVFGDTAVTLSSTAASRAVALIAPRIELRTRPSEPVLVEGTVAEDRGADLVGSRVLFFRSGAIDTPTRAELGTLDLGKSQGTLLTNTPAVISLLPAPGQSAASIFFVADLAGERTVLRPLVPQLVYLDLKTAPGLGDVQIVPPEKFGRPTDAPLAAVPASGLARASLEQVYVPVMPREERAMEPTEASLAPAMREQLQALGIYARAVLRIEEEARGRRAGTFVVVPARARPFESDFEVVDARVEGASVREVLRLAAECGLVGERTAHLDRVADALAEAYEAFYAETASEDGRRFRRWLGGRTDEAASRVRDFLVALRATLAEIERLGLTRHELAGSKAQIYGSLLRPRLNADADFLRLAVEDDLDDSTSIVPPVSP